MVAQGLLASDTARLDRPLLYDGELALPTLTLVPSIQ